MSNVLWLLLKKAWLPCRETKSTTKRCNKCNNCRLAIAVGKEKIRKQEKIT